MRIKGLNPLVFPAETNGRFTLLVLSAFFLTFWIVTFTASALFTRTTGRLPLLSILQGQNAVNNEVMAGTDDVYSLSNEELAALVEGWRDVHLENWKLYFLEGSPSFLWVMLLLGISGVIYRITPAFIRWRQGLRPFATENDRAMWDSYCHIVAETGLDFTPTILLDNFYMGEPSGQAFGRKHNYQLRLTAGQLLHIRSREKFKALIAHELGHLANGDVERTYFAQAIWLAFILVVVGVILTALIIEFFIPAQEPTVNVRDLFQPLSLIGTVGIVTLIWVRLLRIREFYADWWAVQWNTEQTWKAILQDKSEKEERRPWWRRIRPFEPSARSRYEMLEKPLKLFRVSWDLPLLVGVTLAYLVVSVPLFVFHVFILITFGLEVVFYTFLPSLLSFSVGGQFVFLLVFLFIRLGLPLLAFSLALGVMAYTLVHTLGVQVQRETMADLAEGVHQIRSYGKLLVPAGVLSIGLQIGFFISPLNSLRLRGGWALVWLLFCMILVWLWLAFTRALTQITIGSHVGSAKPVRWQSFINKLSTGSLVVVLFPVASVFVTGLIFNSQPTLLETGMITGDSPIIFWLMTNLVLLLIAVAYVAVALIIIAVLYLWRFARTPLPCPECEEPVAQRIVIGQVCQHCHTLLAPWAYI